MSNGRHTKPLFELLRDESSEGRRGMTRPAPPQITPEIKPTRVTPDRELPMRNIGSPVESRGAEAVVPHPEASVTVRGGVLSMSVYAAYLAVAAVLALAVVVWVLAYNSGRRGAEHDLASRFQQDLPPGVTDPRSLVATPRDPLQDAPPSRDEARPSRPDQTPKAGLPTPARPGEIITPSGSLAADPRAPRLNYQVLAYAVPLDEALDMVTLLGKNGLDVIGVPVKVDRPGSGDNNAPLYKVVVGQGLTSEQYKSNDPLRARQEAEVRRLGAMWKASKRGRGDLGSTYWENLKP